MDDTERTACLSIGIVPRDYPHDVAADWPELLDIVRRLVKPLRDKQKRKALRERWWQYADKRPGLYSTIRAMDHVLVTSAAATMHHMIARVPPIKFLAIS